MIQLVIFLVVAAGIAWLFLYMRAQKGDESVQRLITQGKYREAMAEADQRALRDPRDGALHLHRGEAAKLAGEMEEAIRSYDRAIAISADDAAAIEGRALALGHLGRNLDEARAAMERVIELYPGIQEFQALSLTWILLRSGKREEALRIYEDNSVLLDTRFRDDYTDRDPLLAETLFLYAELAGAAGEEERAVELRRRVGIFAPGSYFATSLP